MNTVNQVFNWSRFTAALRKEVIENKRALLITLVCVYGLLTIVMIFGNCFSSFERNAPMDEVINELKTPQITILSILSFVIMISSSLSFKSLTTKTGRIRQFTTPSSTLEKYLVNLLIYVVGMFVAYFACAQLADLTRIAVLWPFRGGSLIVPGPINFLSGFNEFTSLQAFSHGQFDIMFEGGKGWVFFVTLLASASIYFMGSVLWPRLSFLKTFAGIFVLEICVCIIALPLFYLFSNMKSFGLWIFDIFSLGGLSTGMIIFQIILVVIGFGLAWYLFKHKDVVSLKWWK